MKLKLTGATFAALIVYMLTTLIGLVQFNPLSSILRSGLKFAFAAFVFIFLLSYAMEVMNKPTTQGEREVESKKNEQQPRGKAGQTYDKNNTGQNETGTQEETAGEKQKETESFDKEEWDFEDDFSEMEPPVIEYEKNN